MEGVGEADVRSQDKYEENHTRWDAEEESVECIIPKTFQNETRELQIALVNGYR